MNLMNFSTNDLKVMASERLDSVLRTAARKELDRRGVDYGHMPEDERQRMDQRMGMTARRGATSGPQVRRDGRVQIFGGPPGPSTSARRASSMTPAEREDMDRRMGLRSKAPEVRRDGRHQVFEVMTAEDARRALRKAAK